MGERKNDKNRVFFFLGAGPHTSTIKKCKVCDRMLSGDAKIIVKTPLDFYLGVDWRCMYCGSGYNYSDNLHHLVIKNETMAGVS